MSEKNKAGWSSTILSKLGVKTVAFETKKSSKASQFALASALSLCVGAGAAMANDQHEIDGAGGPGFTSESLAQMVIDAEKAAWVSSREETDTVIERSALAAIGIRKGQGNLNRMAVIGGTLIDLAVSPETLLMEKTSSMATSAFVGGATDSVDHGVFAAKMVGTAITISSGVGILVVPATYGGYKTITDKIDQNKNRRLYHSRLEVEERTHRIGLETKFDLQLAARERRAGDSEVFKAQDNQRMIEQVTLGLEQGNMPPYVQERIDLERLVKEAGGITEPWFDTYEGMLDYADHDVQPDALPVESHYLDIVQNMHSEGKALGSSTASLKNIQMQSNSKKHSSDTGLEY